jgi:hypothetical protein
MADAIHIDDLSAPRFSPEVDEMLVAMAAVAPDCQLDVDALHRQAAEETGLDDFGPRDYIERLQVLIDALVDVAGLSPLGLVTFHAQVVQLLRNRLLLTDLLARYPEIHEVELVPPIIIAGLPRTGTTHLHNLLAADPALTTLPYWESLEPFPLAAESDTDPAGRRARCETAVWFMNQAMPLFPLMHEMTTDHVHEEIQLLAIDFSTMFFETLAHVPTWEAYYLAHDQTPHYRYLRTTLQALQHLRGADRWVLKSPQHLEQFGVLRTVFPDATVVVTHRDPVEVVVSLATMIAYTARMHADPVDAAGLGRAWADRVELMLGACSRDHHLLDPERSVDVRFDEFMADDLATARRIYELADQPLTPEAEAAMAEYLAGHERGRLGRIDYHPADVGLDPDELRARFAPYARQFLGS